MLRRPPRSTRTDTLFPTRRSSDLGILRDRMLTNMTEAEWDAVIQVHLKGTFAPSRHAAAYWREQSKEGNEVDGRIINTSSPSGLYGNVRSEEHTSELQSLMRISYAVFCLKKKKSKLIQNTKI